MPERLRSAYQLSDGAWRTPSAAIARSCVVQLTSEGNSFTKHVTHSSLVAIHLPAFSENCRYVTLLLRFGQLKLSCSGTRAGAQAQAWRDLFYALAATVKGQKRFPALAELVVDSYQWPTSPCVFSFVNPSRRRR